MNKKKIPYKFLLITNILLVLVTFFSAYAGVFDPRKFWLFSFLGLLFPILFTTNVLFVVFWMFRKLRYSLISILLFVFIFKQIQTNFGFNPYFDGIEQLGSFKVMSYNTNNFRNNVDRSEVSAQLEKGISFLTNDIKPDIFCAQELTGSIKNKLLNKFENYSIHQIKNKATIIYSKYPIVSKGQIDFNTKTNSCLWADVKVGDRILRVYSIHLQSNRITKETDKLLNDKSTEKALGKVAKILSRYRKYNAQRAKQADRIKKHMANCLHPIVVCGDFNDTPSSYTYKTIRGDLQDTFEEKGFGLGVSYGGKIPGLRIDYILASDELNVINYKTSNKTYSDHYPVISTMKFE